MMKRVDWIDVAKGMAIILIVMLHARDYALSLVPPGPENPIRWVSIDPLFSYIRLPLFFLLSGMLASGSFSRDEEAPRYNVRRALSLARVYLIWSVPMLILIPDWPRDGWRIPAGIDAYAGLLRGASTLWYLWAAVIAFAFACGTRRLPPFAAVILAAVAGMALHLAGGALGGAFGPLGRCLPHYILGIRYPFPLLWLARCRNLIGFLLLLCGYCAALPLFPGTIGFDAAREVLGICVAVIGIGWTTEHWPRTMARLGWLGRRTLPIYIFHFPLLAYLGSAVVRHGRALAYWQATLWLFLPLLCTLVITLSLAIAALLRRLGLGWTLAMTPRSARGGATRRVALA